MLDDAFKFYYIATKLKDMLRQGAVQWNVNKPRLESIAEHTYGCLILAIALHSELKLDINLEKTLEMLTIHELEEIKIGDVTPLDSVNKSDLKNEARSFVCEIVKGLKLKNSIVSLTDEFNNQTTKEARFAKAIDKLECVLEFKKYQDLGQVSVKNCTQEMLKNKKLKELVDLGYDLADIFFIFHMPAFCEFGIDENYWKNNLKNLKIN